MGATQTQPEIQYLIILVHALVCAVMTVYQLKPFYKLFRHECLFEQLTCPNKPVIISLPTYNSIHEIPYNLYMHFTAKYDWNHSVLKHEISQAFNAFEPF